MRSRFFWWIALFAFPSACSEFAADDSLAEVDSGGPEAGPSTEAGGSDAAGSDASGADAADAADAADVGDADVYPGVVVAEAHFEGAGVGCPGALGDNVSLERATTGGRNGGQACRVCKLANQRYFGAFGANTTAVSATYTIYAWLRTDPAGAFAPDVQPTVSVEGTYNGGTFLTPSAAWKRVEHSFVVAAGKPVAWALYSDDTTAEACYLVDDVVFVRQ